MRAVASAQRFLPRPLAQPPASACPFLPGDPGQERKPIVG